MAIYHLCAKAHSRAKGQSAAAKATYITRTGRYARDADEVVSSWSGNMPEWAADDPCRYWQAADQYERANARLCRSYEISLPAELDQDQRKALAKEITGWITDKHQLPHTAAIHRGGGNNPHLHLVLSERVLTERTRDLAPPDFFKQATKRGGGAEKVQELDKRQYLYSLREKWAEICNRHLAQAGLTERIDHRTVEEQAGGPKPTPQDRNRRSRHKPYREAKTASLREDADAAQQRSNFHQNQAALIEQQMRAAAFFGGGMSGNFMEMDIGQNRAEMPLDEEIREKARREQEERAKRATEDAREQIEAVEDEDEDEGMRPGM